MEEPAAGPAWRGGSTGMAVQRVPQPDHRPGAERGAAARAADRGASGPVHRGRHECGAGPVVDRGGTQQPLGRAPGRHRGGVLRRTVGGRHRRPAADPGGDREVAAALRSPDVEAGSAGEGSDPAMSASLDRFGTESPGSDAYAEWDAAYVLGALAPAERLEFEGHLALCTRCRASVAEIAGLPGLLAQVG